jgi:outer membrane protein
LRALIDSSVSLARDIPRAPPSIPPEIPMRRLAFVLAVPAFFTALAFLAPPEAAAQQPLHVFLDAARDGSLDLRQSRASHAQARATVDQARARLLPNGAIQGSYTRNEYLVEFEFPPGSGDFATIQAQDQLAATFVINVPIIDVAGWAQYFQTEEIAAAADAQVDLTQQNVEVGVVQLWHQLVATRAFVDASQRSIAVAEAAHRNATARLEVGAASPLELARATAELERARHTLADAELQTALAGRNLQNVTGLSPDDTVVVLDDDGHEERPLSEFLGHVDSLPLVRAARRQRSAADTGRTGAWLAFAPTVSGQLLERVTNASGFGPSSQWQATLTATWSLDFARPATVMAQDAALDVATVQLEGAEQRAQTAIFEAWHRVRAARAQLLSARAAEEATTRAAEDARALYEAGAATQLDQIQAERDRFGAEVARIQATANLRVARAALRLQSGLALAR